MPELPEVEHAVRRLRHMVDGRTLRDVEPLHPSQARRLGAAERARLANRRIVRVTRAGKHQLLHLDDGRVLHVHFRMSGDWVHVAPGDEFPRHARVALDLDDGSRIALVDPRALCTVALLDDAGALPALGPEPHDDRCTPEWLRAAFARRKSPVKPALLDQRVVAGVGNIYASEALWHARISPMAAAATLRTERLGRLVAGMRAALDRALADPGRYAEGEHAPLEAYGREGEPCRRCGAPIRRAVQAGRSTYWCPRCQRG